MGTLNLRPIPNDLHKALKVEAAVRGTSVRALVVQVLEDWIRREAKGAERLVARPAAAPRRKGGGA